MNTTTLITWNDLASRAEAKLLSARGGDSKAGWKALIEAINELTDSSPELVDTFASQHWRLTAFEISGIRGIGTQVLTLRLPSTAGMTVFHGPNGSGKSSISEAIRLALTQDPSILDPSRGQGGNEEVWEPINRNTFATTAKTSVTLSSEAGDQLTLQVEWGPTTAPELRATLVKEDGTIAEVPLSASWSALVAGCRPIYAFADWDRRIRVVGDLQKYLFSMLVLGDAPERLERHLTHQRQVLADAVAPFNEALIAARPLIPDEIPLPKYPGDPQDGFPQLLSLVTDAPALGSPAPLLDPDDLASRSQDLDATIAQISLGDLALAPVIEGIRRIEETATPDDVCPVCDTSTQWRYVASRKIQAFEDVQKSLEQPFRDAALLVKDCLRLCDALPDNHPERDGRLREASSRANCGLSSANTLNVGVAREINTVAGLLRDDALLESLRAGLIVTSAELAQSARQHEAISCLLNAWDAAAPHVIPKARTEKALTHLSKLREEIVDERTDGLQTGTDKHVRTLLADVGLTIKTMRVQKRQATLTLADSASNAVDLAMLSAGQRNALILAPALTMANSSPFDFAILDDPVHALDDLRIDLLTQLIGKIAQSKRVVIFTHDTRLLEHLAATPTPHFESYTIARRVSGEIDITPKRSMWEDLLEDATNLFQLPGPGNQIPDAVTTTVRGLLRQAVDNAIRDFVMRRPARPGQPTVEESLAELDRSHLTKQRLEWLRLREPDGRAQTAMNHLTVYFDGWNKAMHDNPPQSTVTMTEIRAARNACKAIVHV